MIIVTLSYLVLNNPCHVFSHWAGHVFKMRNNQLPKISRCGELSTGHHNRDKDSLQKSLCACHRWSILVEKRDAWCHTTNYIVSSFENTRKVQQ